MKEDNRYIEQLERRKIKPTALRELILKAMMQEKRAVSILDLENLLDTVD